jgi:nucleoside-diphosphate-sugar epimerase
MRIFVTGATGVLGQAVVKRLIAEGRAVHALSLSEANREMLHGFGAQPMQSDLLNGESLKQALAGCEAVLHLATRIAPTSKMAKRTSWYDNDRIRREGTRALVEAALAVDGIRTLIYPSYAFVYPDSADRWIDASTTPVQPTPTLQSTVDAEDTVAQLAGEQRRGFSLRMGSLYGPESPATHEQLDYAHKGIAALPGHGEAYLPQISVQDGARALVAALMQPIPSGIYNAADDEPLTRDEVFALLAQAVGRKRLWQPPALLMRVKAGVVYDTMSRSLRVSNRRFKEVSGWRPLVPNARIGWARIAQQSGAAIPVF